MGAPELIAQLVIADERVPVTSDVKVYYYAVAYLERFSAPLFQFGSTYISEDWRRL